MVTQLPASQPLDRLRAELSTRFPPRKVDEMLAHYSTLRKEARLDHYESCLVNGGKFVEAVLKCLHFLRTGNEVDSLKADSEINQLEAAASLNSSERMIIPRTLRIIYEHRNKRGGAHNSSFDPIKMDCLFVVSAANWVMEEFVRLYWISDPNAAQALVQNLLVKDIPLIEEIDGDYLVLMPNLSARIQLELFLYKHYPSRCTVKDLICWIRHHSSDNVRTTLRDMKKKNLVHEIDTGYKLTERGVHEAEREIDKILCNENNNSVKKNMKGNKRARR